MFSSGHVAGHVLHRSTVRVVQQLRGHASLDIIRLCVLSKINDGMPCLMSFDRVFSPRNMMGYHA